MRAGCYGLAGFWAWQLWLVESKEGCAQIIPSVGILRLATSLLETNHIGLQRLGYQLLMFNGARSDDFIVSQRMTYSSGLEALARFHLRNKRYDNAARLLNEASCFVAPSISTAASLTMALSYAYMCNGDKKKSLYQIDKSKELVHNVDSEDPRKLMAHFLFRKAIDDYVSGSVAWGIGMEDAIEEYGNSLCDDQSGRFFKGLVHLSLAIGLSKNRGNKREIQDHFCTASVYLMKDNPNIYSLSDFGDPERLPTRRDILALSFGSDSSTQQAKDEIASYRKSCMHASLALFPKAVLNVSQYRSGDKKSCRSFTMNELHPVYGSSTIGIVQRAATDCAKLGIVVWPGLLIRCIWNISQPLK